MSYELQFKKTAYKEWNKLGATIRKQFKNKLIEVLEQPHIPASQLSGTANLYKIKLRSVGYRLVYQVDDQTVIVTVIAIGKRGGGKVYTKALSRIEN